MKNLLRYLPRPDRYGDAVKHALCMNSSGVEQMIKGSGLVPLRIRTTATYVFRHAWHTCASDMATEHTVTIKKSRPFPQLLSYALST